MENFRSFEVEFDDNDLNNLIGELQQCFSNSQDTFVRLCYTIHNIWSYCKNSYWKARDNEYYNCYKLLSKFGFDKKAVSRYKKCFETFMVASSYIDLKLQDIFQGFSSSKLFELLPLSYATICQSIDKRLITSEMTTKEIRAVVKEIKGGKTVEKVIEEKQEINDKEIPMVYDVNKQYDFEYFQSKTKNQLLNIVWELQQKYQALLKKKVKVK